MTGRVKSCGPGVTRRPGRSFVFGLGPGFGGASGSVFRIRRPNKTKSMVEFMRPFSNSSQSQLAPHTGQMPAILVITNETTQMQPDPIQAGEINEYHRAVFRLTEFAVVRHRTRLSGGGWFGSLRSKRRKCLWSEDAR